MTFEVIFIISGAAIALLLYTKMSAIRSRKNPMLLRLISLGNERMRGWSHMGAHLYTEHKEKARIIMKNQLPLHSKNIWNKANAAVKEKANVVAEKFKNSKLMRKEEGLEEFLKSISERENSDSDSKDTDL